MGLKVKDYILEIDRRKQNALEDGKTHLIIQAGNLHSEFGKKGSPTLNQCCSAMKQCMLEGDEIIFEKENKSGISSALTIKYDVNISGRKSISSVKKRGRPAGKKSFHTEVNKKNDDPQNINMCIENWMKKEKMKYSVLGNQYLINDSYGLWIIPKYIDKCDGEKFIESIKLIRDEHYKCSIIFKNTKEAHFFWNTMSESVIERLNITALFVSDNKQIFQEY